MKTPTRPPEGRIYHLRPRGSAGERALESTDNVVQLAPPRRAREKALAVVHALPLLGEVLCTSATVFEHAWASHQRVYGERGLSFRRVLTGAGTGTAAALLVSRRAARAVPDCEDWLETLQVDGRTIREMFLADRTWVPPSDEHDCDCTCVGTEGHGRWEEQSASWIPLRVGVLLGELVAGTSVRVRLAPAR